MTNENTIDNEFKNFLLGTVFLFIAIGIIIFLTGINREIFFVINGFSKYTGGKFWQYLTVLGDGYLTAVLILLFINRKPKIAWSFVIATVIYMIILHSLKDGLNITRPPGVLDSSQFNLFGPGHTQGSFPSGHTTTIFTLTTVIGLCQKSLKRAMGLILISLLIGISRIAIGVHWPLDVCAGAILGIISGIGGVYLSQFTQWGYSKIARIVFYILLVPGGIYMVLFYSTGHEATYLFTRIVGIFCLIYWLIDLLVYYNLISLDKLKYLG